MSTQLVQQELLSDHKEKRHFLQQVIGSPVLHGSEALCHLLRYLAEHALESPHTPMKEYQIATEVFGRSVNFDPRIDSTVRVQTRRLGCKLAEYYGGPGASDRWQIDIPRGSYSLIFHEQFAKPQTPGTVPPTPKAYRRADFWPWLVAAVAITALVSVLMVRIDKRVALSTPVSETTLLKFWRSALPHPAEPLVVFSNAEFVGRPETGMRYLNPAQDAQSKVLDHYTGVGEVIAVHQLDELFEMLGRKFLLKRGRLMNWDDAKNRDVIFVGSPSENLAVRELSLNRDFSFEVTQDPARRGDLGIHNLKPQPGEPAWYFGPHGLPITEDYALIELSGGTSASRTLLLAGTTTFGTQGAVEFICREDKVADLLSKLDKGKPIGKLSVLLHVNVQRGVPVDSEIIALRNN